MEEYRARGASAETISHAESRLNRWRRWLKGRRPRIEIEKIDAEMLTQYIGKRASFRSKATVSATLSSMRVFGDYLVRQGLSKINLLRRRKGPKVTHDSRSPTRI
jgi:site-specific recombinase XerD